jgi:2-polyprenyl-6-methoxyphenol hydroxylase-like FAD-dependent oxidoreductase
LSYEPPQETIVNAFLGYASRCYRYPASTQDWKSLMIWQRPPEHSRGAIFLPIEADRAIVIFAGLGRDYPPTDEAGFLKFARELRSPIFAEVIQAAEPLSPIYGYRRTENRLRHFDRLSRSPENFIALGDAVCAFNPVYGQGMTVATLEAIALGECLTQHRQQQGTQSLTGLAHCCQKRFAEIVATPWLMATAEDFRWSTTVGGQANLQIRFLHRYLNHVRASTIANPLALQTFLEVVHMLKPPTALFQPQVLLPVLRRMIDRQSNIQAGQAPIVSTVARLTQ